MGTIIVTGRHQVKGLTTAATLWATACMGLAIGIDFYKAAIKEKRSKLDIVAKICEIAGVEFAEVI